MASVQVNDDGNRYCGFGRGNSYDENHKENSIQLIGVQIFIEHNKIDVLSGEYEIKGVQEYDHFLEEARDVLD